MGKWKDKYQYRVGETRINRDGVKATIIEYNGARDIVIRYDDYDVVKKICRWERFDKGNFETPTEFYQENKIGKQFKNSRGESATCIQYDDYYHIKIQFDDSNDIIDTSWCNFSNGQFHKQYRITDFGGVYDVCESIKSNKKEYDAWHSIFKRCYSNATHKNRGTYIECEICDEWKKFSVFRDWLRSQENYLKWNTGGKNWHIDKDILVKHNKVYSPATCVLVPGNVNGLLGKCDAKRGLYPIGVYYDSMTELFKAQCENPYHHRQISLGWYEDPETAFYNGYKPYKERIIKKVAKEEYDKHNITKQCYDALMNYVVEIDD